MMSSVEIEAIMVDSTNKLADGVMTVETFHEACVITTAAALTSILATLERIEERANA